MSIPWRSLGTGAALGALCGYLARDLGLVGAATAWIAASALGALLWALRMRVLVIAALGAVGLAWVVVAFTPVTSLLARGLVRRDPPAAADAVVVLASGIQRDGEPTAAAMSRLLHGLELLAEGRACRLILTELPPPSPPYTPLVRAWMARFGVQADLLSVGPVRRTRDEAVQVSALCRERGWNVVLVVTSPTHSRRASAAMEREGLRVIASPAVETQYDVETLRRPGERLPAFASILHEQLGLWYYRWRGWLPDASE